MAHNLESRPDRYADIAIALGVTFPQLVTESQNVLKSDSMDIASKLFRKMDFAYLRDKFIDASSWLRGTAAKQDIGAAKKPAFRAKTADNRAPAKVKKTLKVLDMREF